MVNWFNHLYPYSNVHELNLDWIINSFKAFGKELEEFRNIIKEYDISRAEVIEMIDEATAICKKYTDDSLVTFKNNEVIPYVQGAISDFNTVIRLYIDAQDQSYYQAQSRRTDAIAEDLVEYIDQQVINTQSMVNPITGQVQPIPDVIDDIVETFHRVNALTAGQYDGYELTANAYDSQLISAYAYDFDGVNQVIH